MKKLKISEFKWIPTQNDIDIWQNIYQTIKEKKLISSLYWGKEHLWLRILNEQKAGGIVYGNFDKENSGDLKNLKTVYNELRKKYFEEMVLVNLREMETERVIKLFNYNGIYPIILKGIYLQNFVYRFEEPRISTDIDILVEEKDHEKAYSILSELGYQSYIYYSKGFAKRFMKSITFIPLKGTKNYFLIDLHKYLFYSKNDKRFYVDKILLCDDLYELKDFRGLKVRVMKSFVSFFYSIYHLFKAHFSMGMFNWIYDIVLLYQLCEKERREKDLEELVKTLKEYDLFNFSKELIGSIVSQENRINTKVEFHLRDHQVRYKFLNVKGFINKVLWLMWLLFPSKEFLKYTYGEKESLSKLRIKHLKEKLFGFVKKRKE